MLVYIQHLKLSNWKLHNWKLHNEYHQHVQQRQISRTCIRFWLLGGVQNPGRWSRRHWQTPIRWDWVKYGFVPVPAALLAVFPNCLNPCCPEHWSDCHCHPRCTWKSIKSRKTWVLILLVYKYNQHVQQNTDFTYSPSTSRRSWPTSV